MRLVIDTNILVSALLAATSLPAQLVVLWRTGRFDLLTTAEQLDELMRVTRHPRIRERLAPAIADRLVNDLRALATTLLYWDSSQAICGEISRHQKPAVHVDHLAGHVATELV